MFDCPLCGKKDSCAVRLDFEHKLGTIDCDGCGAEWSTRVEALHAPIDVYSDWIDACEAVNDGEAPAGLPREDRDDDGYADDPDED